MDPSFLPAIEYPSKLFGMFLVIGSEFRGFHLRFKDIARGGIRIVRSRNRENFSINLRSLFDENYGLAATQQRKNKDIPESGSKGTILLDITAQDKPRVAFEKYVDAILDLLIVGQSPGIKEKIVDLYGKPEILFFGPDEGTADMMDWASSVSCHCESSSFHIFCILSLRIIIILCLLYLVFANHYFIPFPINNLLFVLYLTPFFDSILC